MPNNRAALHEIERDEPRGVEDVLEINQRNDVIDLVSVDSAANIVRGNTMYSRSSASLDEEVIQRRGKRVRRYNIITRSMDPMILATRKSPIKRARSNTTSLDIISMLSEVQKSPRTPKKSKQSASPMSPGVMTRKRLNMSADSGVGLTPNQSAGSASLSSSSPPSTKRNRPPNRTAADRRRRSRQHNLRRLSS